MFVRFNILKTRILILWKYRKYFRLFKKTIKLGDKIFRGKQVIWDEGNDFSKIIIVFFAQNIHRMRSIEILCKVGLARDAVGLLRAMFESLVDFQYMYSDKKRIENYLDYAYCQQLRLGRIILGSSSKKIDKNKVEERQKELQGQWNSVKHKFTILTKTGKKQVCRRWSCKNLREICKEFSLEGVDKKVNFEETYDYLYGYLSYYTHSSPLIASDYVLGLTKDRKKVTTNVGTSEILIDEVLVTANAVFIEMLLKIVDKEYQMSFGNKLEGISKKLVKDIEDIPN